MLFSNALDAKVVDDQQEADGTGVMGPKGRRSGDRAIPKLGQMGGESVIGDAAGLF